MKRILLYLTIVATSLASSPKITHAIFADTTEPVPITRLIYNMLHYVSEHPADAHGHYILGRVYSLGYTKMITVNMELADWQGNPYHLPQFAPWDKIYQAKVDDPTLTPRQLHLLKKSIAHYYHATTLNPNNALYYLGLGWMLEQGIAHAETLGPPPYDLPWVDTKVRDLSFSSTVNSIVHEDYEIEVETLFNYYKHDHYNAFKHAWDEGDEHARNNLKPYLTELWRNECLWAYRQAFANEIYYEARLPYLFLSEPDGHPGMEAGEGIIRVIGDDAAKPYYAWEVEAIQAAAEYITSKGAAITPIIFSLTHSGTMNDLLAPQTTTSFDIDGDNLQEQCAWLQPETAILVWDPEDGQQITSGRQLFGSVTWWMFWRNGYEAMNALDNDRDGWLQGDELEGLAIWQDRNQNGVSDDGEVTPISATEIAAIATKPEVNQEQNISHSQGLKLKDGRVLPTYDWFPEEVR